MLNKCSVQFQKKYPLLKILKFDEDNFLLYDSKSDFCLILTEFELEYLEEILLLDNAKIISNAPQNFVAKVEKLIELGAFKSGFLDERVITSKEDILKQLRYYFENVPTHQFAMEITDKCNLRCKYCVYTINEEESSSARSHGFKHMDINTAKKAIDFYYNRYTQILKNIHPSNRDLFLVNSAPMLSWYGGEPLLNFELLKFSMNYFKQKKWNNYDVSLNKLAFSITTNFTYVTKEILDFLIENKIHLHVSLDGKKEVNDDNRVFLSGKGTYDVVKKNLEKIKNLDVDYYYKFVSIQGVVPSNKFEFSNQYISDLHEVFSDSDKGKKLRITNFDCGETCSVVSNISQKLPKLVLEYENILTTFKNEVSKITPEQFEVVWNTNQNEFISLRKYFNLLENDLPIIHKPENIILTCPMGFDAIMVSVNGDLHMCTKTDGSLPLGDVISGYNFDDIGNYYIGLHKRYNNVRCKKCWAHSFCSICAATACKEGEFIFPSEKECEFIKLNAQLGLEKFIHLAKSSWLIEKIEEKLEENSLIKDISTL